MAARSGVKSVLLAALLLAAAPAFAALTLDQARTQGMVGETLGGYLAAIENDAETQALVTRINNGRQREYARLAEQNNLTTREVASIAGQKLVARAKAGEYVRGINGQWLQK
ncbi:DUF1318 domain-containing protein [Erwinia sp. E602]|uniref:YdbL family protein n=1 Tax=Erwinia sp. E602 TaxID=2675378 RepID=UPI001BA51D56|nr:DUF1318 domain-containing protein [Erwinia sp. E602]QUG75774.1 DUF1318 domain-containing protein [Erwinia sp. E602]